MATRIPRTVRNLAQFGIQALQPSMKAGRYFGPLVPKRKASVIRKQAISEGTYGSFDPVKGRGWDATWDELKVRKMHFLRPHKGHARERTRPERAAKIKKAMEGMPDRLAKYKAEMVERRPKKDMLSMFDRVQRISKTKSLTPPPRSQNKGSKGGGNKK